MLPEIRNIEDHWRGTLWGGLTITSTLINGTALTSNLTAVHCVFRKRNQPTVMYHLYNGAGITITDAATGAYRFDPQKIDFDAALYDFDVKITLANGNIYPAFSGIWIIKQDYSYGY